MNEVDKGTVKRRLQLLQEFRRAKKRRVPTNVIEVFTLKTELVEEPVVSASETNRNDVPDADATMTESLKRALEKAENAKVEIVHDTKAHTRRRRVIPRRLTSRAKSVQKKASHARPWNSGVQRPQDASAIRR